ncbi:MAG: 50S ribosomal protein L32e [Caldisphaera sp.]|jgi:large subunit ribosomal protein L32e|nr:MAG: 50S ribosomal protein L32e [Caldisphaera sp.]PMP90853.1 MAG: 50S ribosomal protein L32e [Caldisphaera sp.]
MTSREENKAKIKVMQRRKVQSLIKEKRRVHFMRYLSWRFKRLQKGWRKPKGIDAKMRLQRKGYPPIVKVGYKGNKFIRGLHPSGLIPVVVSSVKDLESLSSDVHIVYISSSVGIRKRLTLLEAAKKRNLKIANGGSYGL